MSQSYEPHRLAIQHLSVLESANKIVEEAEKKIFEAIDVKVKHWVDSRGNWEGVYGYIEEETSFKPNNWEKDEENYCAYYTFEAAESETYLYWLSPMIGAVSAQFGIYFGVRVSWVTRLSGRGMQAAWIKYLAEQFTKTNLKKLGFQLQGDRLFLPILVDVQTLADNYPHSMDDALGPIDEALKIIDAAHPEIDSLLKAALQYSFAKSSQSST